MNIDSSRCGVYDLISLEIFEYNFNLILNNLKHQKNLNFNKWEKFLQSLTKDGKLLWESEADFRTLSSQSETIDYFWNREDSLADIKNLAIDTENNIYFAYEVLSGCSLYCFSQNCERKWELKLPVPKIKKDLFTTDQSFNTYISACPDQSIYFVDYTSNTIYCIRDEEIKK
jgi:hypothetical protein